MKILYFIAIFLILPIATFGKDHHGYKQRGYCCEHSYYHNDLPPGIAKKMHHHEGHPVYIERHIEHRPNVIVVREVVQPDVIVVKERVREPVPLWPFIIPVPVPVPAGD